MADWKAIAGKIKKKELAVAERNRGRIPYTTAEGERFDDRSGAQEICWWTNGFWGGVLWQMHNLTGDELYLREQIFFLWLH